MVKYHKILKTMRKYLCADIKRSPEYIIKSRKAICKSVYSVLFVSVRMKNNICSYYYFAFTNRNTESIFNNLIKEK